MLSKRLKAISEMIMKNEVVFDCGSDHALLPCFLVLNGICPKAYAGDKRQGPLKQALNNIDNYHLNGRVIPVLSDGLSKMSDDVTVVVIAGMGFYTVKDILEAGELSKLKQIVVQVNRNADKLREYLAFKHYTITDERVVKDNFYYEIIAFSPLMSDREYTRLELKYGPLLLKRRDPVFIDYLHYQLKALKNIYLQNHDADIAVKIAEIEGIIKAAY